MFFDDSFWHHASHDGVESDRPRVIFMVDLWHPDLTEVEIAALNYAYQSI